MRALLGWILIGVVAGGGAGIWWAQRATARGLDAEIAATRTRATGAEQLEAERQRLSARDVADERLNALRQERGEIYRLREEIGALRSQATEWARAESAMEAEVAEERFAPGSVVPAGEWRNAGAATPAATLETVLWAAAGGDVEAMARLLSFDHRARVAAEALRATMPEAIRAQYDTPERLMAFLAIKDVPLGAAEVRAWSAGVKSAVGTLRLTGPDGKAVNASLLFSRVSGEWRLFVREDAVAKYAGATR